MTTGTPPADATHGPSRRAADRLLLRVGGWAGPWTWILAAAALGVAAAELALPAVLGRGLDAVVAGEALGWWVAALAGLVAVLVVFDALDDVAAGGATARATAALRETLLDRLLALGPRAARLAPGDVASRLVGNAAEAGRAPVDLVRAGGNLLPGIGGIVALGLIDPWLAGAFLLGVPVLLIVLRAFVRRASDVAGRYLAVQGEIAGRLVDAVAGGRTIAAAGTLERERRRVLEPLGRLSAEGMAMWRAQTRLAAQDVLLVSVLEVGVLAVAGVLLARGRITPGELLAAAQYVLLGATLTSAVSAVDRLVRARAAAGRALELLEQPLTPPGTRPLPPGPGRVELRGVSAGAAGQAVLGGVDLTLPPGALVAVVGPTGSGKSLLGALIGGLVEPDAGEVTLDGVPLQEIERGALRRAVGYGFERPQLLGETVADAIAFGAERPIDADLVAAARQAGADEFVRRLPNGYATPLAAAPLSGGEAQRLGLARAFCHAGRVLVLDDVAASLDTVTEHRIGEALTGPLAGRTRVVVAHRAATAARADLVVWLDDGGIRAVAPHDELWADRRYRALFAADHAEPDGNGKGGSPRP